ncbi:MAG: S-layer homology domain-containing protein, partial [Clostridia bacterium]|nr:S-layer homology domain-containing protein [Clostridia bacterium]
MKNKLIAFFTVLALAFQMLPAWTVAAEDDSADSDAVKLLTALEIMDVDSYSGKLWDDTPVKRREMAQIICNLFRFEVTKDDVPRFNDVQDKYRGYVETVVRNGYMSGYNDKSFGANDYVTGNQLLKILVTALGGGEMAKLSGGFPMGYIYAARRLGLSNVNSVIGDEPARRIDVANMIYSALEADIMMIASINEEYSTYTTIEGHTFLSETLDIYRYEGIVNQNEATALDDPNGAGEDRVQIGETVHMDEEKLTADYLGSSVVAYVRKPDKSIMGSVVCVIESGDNETLVIENKDFSGVNGFNLEYFDGEKKKSIKLSPGIDMIYNGKAIEYDPEKFTMDIGNIKLVDNNNDGMYDVVLITSYETFVVEKVNAADEIIGVKHGKASIELNGNFYSVSR